MRPAAQASGARTAYLISILAERPLSGEYAPAHARCKVAVFKRSIPRGPAGDLLQGDVRVGQVHAFMHDRPVEPTRLLF